MKYNTINELDARIENIIKRNVKYYYTDWKNYDRPKYMKLKGSSRWIDKGLVLIVRDCGTYLFTLEELATRPTAAAIYEYYYQQETGNHYYTIDLEKLTINHFNPERVRIGLAA